jgi:hypothetical protein
VRRVAKCGARCSSRYVSLHGAVLFSYPRKGVQSASDCRIQNAPPPLMPEKATSASVRPAALGRPRIPSLSSTRTARSPLVWLALLTRACHVEPLAPGSSCSPAAGLTPPAGPKAVSRLLVTLGPSLCALVTQNRWLLARPAVPLLVSLRRLVLKRLRACSQHSARPYARLSRRTGLRRQIPWWRRSVFARANSTGIRLLSSSSTLVVNSFDCNASLVKKT